MKSVLLITLVMIAFFAVMFTFTTSFGYEVPEALKGGNITVTLKNGKTYSFKSDSFKVVPRLDQVQVSPEPRLVIVQAPKAEPMRNRVRLGVGAGPGGMVVIPGASSVKLHEDYGGIGSAAYDRMLTDRNSIGVQAISNGSYILNIGYDF